MSLWRLLEDDPRFGMSAGDVLECRPYRWDPDKLTVIRRVSDGYDPGCNVYRTQVERFKAEDTRTAAEAYADTEDNWRSFLGPLYPSSPG